MNFTTVHHSVLKKFYVGGLAIIVGVAPLGAAAPACNVSQDPPKVEYNTFEPGHPPPLLSQAPGVEAAFCFTRFGCVCGVMAETPKFTFGLGAAKVTAVQVTTQAHITVWTPVGGPPEYMAHEETHRAISAHYYRNAGAVATRLAEKLLGKKIDLPKRKTKAMLDEALNALREQLIADFMHEIAERNDFAQERFDDITDHGRDQIPNPEAMARAITDEEAHWKSVKR